MVENMDSTRDVWAMQLDTIRNRIIRVELLVAVASFSLMVSTVPAGFFGMNLTSGLEVRVLPILLCLVLRNQLQSACVKGRLQDSSALRCSHSWPACCRCLGPGIQCLLQITAYKIASKHHFDVSVQHMLRRILLLHILCCCQLECCQFYCSRFGMVALYWHAKPLIQRIQ